MAVVAVSWKSNGMPLGTLDGPPAEEESAVSEGLANYVKAVKTVDYTYTQAYPSVFTTALQAPVELKPIEKEAARVVRHKTLAYVNVARTALGYRPLDDLPMGHRGNANQCVLARAIPGAVGVGGHISFLHERMAAKVGAAWCVPVHERVVPNPASLSEFVHRFDNGQYPDLTL